MNAMTLLSWMVCSVAAAAPGSSGGEATPSAHRIQVQERVLTSDDGLLLGNGDLSVSVYETADRIVWRFGKNDVWDRRLDLSDDPKPAHIDEIAHGIEVEGWKCPPYGEGPPVSTRGTENPQRMIELCQGAPPSYTRRPYPCPKPVGELALQLPPDQMGLQIRQDLVIEEATLAITCTWSTGLVLHLNCFVPPSPNVLVVQWKLENWNEQTRTGNGLPPLLFYLYRWADPTIQAFAARFFGEYGHGAFQACSSPKATPAPPPSVQKDGDVFFIEQTFPPDPLFPEGFRYALAPFGPQVGVQPVDMAPTGEARLRLTPLSEGCLVVAVTTSSDVGGPIEALRRVFGPVKAQPAETTAQWSDANRRAAAAFWSKSAVRIADPVLENIWYETLHAQRCVCRSDTPPPGLFLPSTVNDYSHWHGDYHTNYNLQQPYWADYTANHLDLADAYFKAIEYFLPIGRKIAKDYYNCRGVFIQLSGYPILAQDDPLGCVPMGRMAYMTGWAMNQYWWRYLYSMDKDWLRATGYPVIRDCALFYTDFLKKGTDGLYHAFPSNQGEDGFSGNPKDYTDRAQVMQHLRYCLRAAIAAADALDLDPELRVEWRDRLEHCAGDDGKPPVALTGIEKRCYEANPPEFGYGRPLFTRVEQASAEAWPPAGDGFWTWYLGQYACAAMPRLRAGDFAPERDVSAYSKLIQRWRHPNGLVWGMAIANYGHAGAWTETLGIIAPLQEMMLQSWDGALRLFPAWPKDLDARFESFRAEGAFLVTAASSGGQVQDLQITSERGGPCRLWDPWPTGVKVTNADGTVVAVQRDSGQTQFETSPGHKYRLAKME